MNKIVLAIILLIVIAFGFLFFGGTASKDQNLNPINTTNNQINNTNNNMPIDNSNPNVFDIQGMKVEILRQGTGTAAKTGDNVLVNYVGTFTNGTKFDSSYDRNTPFPFTIGQGVIEGWSLGVAGMKIGEKRRLTIPYTLGYGENDYGPIPGKSTLIFEVELLGINQ